MQKQNSSLKYGLNVIAKKVNPPVARSSVFTAAEADDDDDDDVAQQKQQAGDGRPKVNKQLSSYTSYTNKKVQEQHAQALKEDSTVFDYDSVYDDLKKAERQKIEEVKGKTGDVKKPRYIGGLLQMAEVRKRDRLRAEDRKIQREREQEGEEFGDKEMFVTEAYKAQQEELRKQEEEEKKREADQDSANHKNLTGFYRKLLDTSTATHDAALQATKKSTKPGDPAPEPIPATEEDTAQDVDIAETARRAGKNVTLNDDNQIVDKRQLLSAGLNIIAKPGSSATSSRGEEVRSREYAEHKRRKWEEEEERRRKGGSDKQSRERLSRDIEKQMLEKEEKEREEERRKEEETKQKLAKRTTEETKMDAKARYLARKKQKTEDKEES